MDRSSKIILALIAAGLWANFAVSVLHGGPALAQTAWDRFHPMPVSIEEWNTSHTIDVRCESGCN
jgi:hypothetical protein